jgi:NAD(P)-dependent dehydrogenase (short-subunit alcohol dehydrogenase family)
VSAAGAGGAPVRAEEGSVSLNVDGLGLAGRVALVTGAGRGIGREIALLFARAGAAVVIADLDVSAGDAVGRELETMGARVAVQALDVRRPEIVQRVVQDVVAEFSAIDVLVNSAGIVSNTPAEEIPTQEWLDVLDVNLNGTFWTCREVGRHMLGRGRGAIVNIASMSGLVANRPQPQAHYNASKAAVIMLTRSLAVEWAGRGVRVNSVSPGYVATDLTKRGMENVEWARTWMSMTPLGRIGTPLEVAQAVLYLASDAASFATGTNLVLDGGYTSW